MRCSDSDTKISLNLNGRQDLEIIHSGEDTSSECPCSVKQESIPVGCVPPALVATTRRQ